jgi:hypothetical protein
MIFLCLRSKLDTLIRTWDGENLLQDRPLTPLRDILVPHAKMDTLSGMVDGKSLAQYSLLIPRPAVLYLPWELASDFLQVLVDVLFFSFCSVVPRI